MNHYDTKTRTGTLSSTSTNDEVLAGYADNAIYAKDGNTIKCKTFIAACRLLLSPAMNPRRASNGGWNGEQVELHMDLVRRELANAQRWFVRQQDQVAKRRVRRWQAGLWITAYAALVIVLWVINVIVRALAS